MAEAGFAKPRTKSTRPPRSPLVIATRALENEAPYFVDYASQLVEERFAGLLATQRAVDIYTTLDLHLQRFAQEAVGRRHRAGRQTARRAQAQGRRAGRTRGRRSADRRNSGHGRRPRLQPVAVQPRRHRAAPARIDVQAVRLSRRVRTDGRDRRRPSSRRRRSSSTNRRRSRTARTTTRRPTSRTNTTAPSRCAARSRSRATSSPSRWPNKRAISTSPTCGPAPRSARRRAPIRRSRWACSRPRRSTWPRPTRSSPTVVSCGRCGRSRASRIAARPLRTSRREAAARRARRRDLPRRQHDAQRDQRRHGAPASAARGSRSTPPARRAPPTTCATPGSPA